MRPGHVWCYDFVQDRTQDGRAFRMLTVVDEFTRQCLAIVTERKLNSDDVLHCLTELFTIHGPPEHIRSDNGSDFTAKAVRRWLGQIGVPSQCRSASHPTAARWRDQPLAARSHIGNPKADQIAAAQFAVNAEVEERKIADLVG